MQLENITNQENPTSVRERLPHGYKLLFAAPTFLSTFAYMGDMGIPQGTFNEGDFMRVMNEYYSIYSLLVELVGKENIIVLQNRFITGRYTPKGVEFKSQELPEETINFFGIEEFAWLNEFYKSWPRDAHTTPPLGFLQDATT